MEKKVGKKKVKKDGEGEEEKREKKVTEEALLFTRRWS